MVFIEETIRKMEDAMNEVISNASENLPGSEEDYWEAMKAAVKMAQAIVGVKAAFEVHETSEEFRQGVQALTEIFEADVLFMNVR